MQGVTRSAQHSAPTQPDGAADLRTYKDGGELCWLIFLDATVKLPTISYFSLLVSHLHVDIADFLSLSKAMIDVRNPKP